MTVKVMTPEEQFDSIFQVLAPNQDPRGMSLPKGALAGMKGAKRQGLTARTAFVAFFEDEDATDPTEFQQGIPQALRLMNGPGFNNAAVLNPLLKGRQDAGADHRPSLPDHPVGRPTAPEQERLVAYVAQHKNEAHEGYEDVLWVLMNSSEFVMNH